MGRVVPLIAIAATILTISCGDDQVAPSNRLAPNKDIAPALMLSGAVAPATRRDSIALVNAIARAVAVSFQDSLLRNTFSEAFRRSSVREGKLHLQLYLAARGAGALDAIEQKNGLPAGGLATALSRVPELEIYIPIRSQRASWNGAANTLVAGLLSTDEELRRDGDQFLAYDIDGQVQTLSNRHLPIRPVIVLVPRESDFGPDGESRGGAFGPQGTDCYETLKGLRTDGTQANDECPWEDPPPPPPTDPCQSNFLGQKLAVCRVQINDVSQYEGWPRGSPEVTVLMFSVLPDGTGYASLGCINEDATGAAYYDQDTDTWTGSATIVDSASFHASVASGKRVGIMLWEDDTGSKCTLQTTNSSVSGLYLLIYAGASMGCAQAFDYDGDPTQVVIAVACAIDAIVAWVATTDDDAIGAANRPANTQAYIWPIARDINGVSTNVGAVSFRRAM